MRYVVEIRTAKGWKVELETSDRGEAFSLVALYDDRITEWRLSCERKPQDVVIDLQAQVRRSANARSPIAAAMVAAIPSPEGGTA